MYNDGYEAYCQTIVSAGGGDTIAQDVYCGCTDFLTQQQARKVKWTAKRNDIEQGRAFRAFLKRFYAEA